MSTRPTDFSDIRHDGFFTQSLADADPAIAAGIAHELDREQTQIELIASENIVSKAVLEPTETSSASRRSAPTRASR